MEKIEENKIRVIVCRPMQKAEVVEIKDDLPSMQETVGGFIEEYMPLYHGKIRARETLP